MCVYNEVNVNMKKFKFDKLKLKYSKTFNIKRMGYALLECIVKTMKHLNKINHRRISLFI